MYAETIDEAEMAPSQYPDVPDGLTIEAAALDSAMLWQRIEAYTAHRYTLRDITWLVEGKGHWDFPLKPAVLASAEQWTGDAWEPVTLSPGPYGYCLPDMGPYRIVANVGGGSVPAAVQQAFKRLAEYLAPGQPNSMLLGRPGASSHTGTIDNITETIERSPAWIAKAMQYSGAADLLRPYRRA